MARAGRRADRPGHPAQRDRHPLPHQRPVRGLRVGPGRRGHALPRPWRRAVLRPQGGAPGGPAAARRRPRRRRQQAARRARARRPRRCRLDASGRRPAAGRSASAGSRCRRSPRWPTTSSRRPPRRRLPELVRELDERAAAQHAPTVQGVTLASLHAAKGLEWDCVFLVGLQRRADPDQHGRRARGHRGGAPAALRRADPRPPRAAPVVVRARATPAAASRGARRVSSTVRPACSARAPAPRPGRRVGGPPARQAGQVAKPARCRTCGAELITAAAAQDRPLRRLPAHLRRGDVRGAAHLAAGRRARDQGAGIRRLHRRHARPRSPSASRPTSRRSPRSRGSGRAKLARLRRVGAVDPGWGRPGRGRPKRFCCNEIRGARHARDDTVVKLLR